MKDFLSRAWTVFAALDTRLKNSAAAGIVLAILTTVLIGLPGYFKDDNTEAKYQANISRPLYETKIVEEACFFDKFIALERKTLLAVAPMTQAPTPENFVAGLQSYVDFARSARPVVADMQKVMQGVVPPQELAEDHDKLLASTQVLTKIIDDLDRSLPTGLNRPAAELLADPLVIDKVLNSTRVITGAANTLGKVEYSAEFNRLFVCPDLGGPLAPVR